MYRKNQPGFSSRTEFCTWERLRMAICSGIFKSLGDCLVLTMLRVRSGQGRNVDFIYDFWWVSMVIKYTVVEETKESMKMVFLPTRLALFDLFLFDVCQSTHVFFSEMKHWSPPSFLQVLAHSQICIVLHRFASFCTVCLVVESFRLSSSHCVMRWTLASRTGPMTISLVFFSPRKGRANMINIW